MCSLKVIVGVSVVLSSCVFTYGRPKSSLSREDYKFIKLFNSFYKLHRGKATWGEAVTTCEAEGAALFYPHDEHEAKNVTKELDVWNGMKPIIWIGISDLQELGIYETIDGLDVSEVYSDWSSNEPHSGAQNELRCVFMYSFNSYLKTAVNNCETHRPFICVIKNKEGTSNSIYNFDQLVGEHLKKLPYEKMLRKIQEIANILGQASTGDTFTSAIDNIISYTTITSTTSENNTAGNS